MKRLLNWLFGSKTKYGKCKWWNHDIVTTTIVYMSGTGIYVNGHEVKRKKTYEEYRCTKCTYIDRVY